jgi:phosphonate transport system permease protein
MGAASLPSAGAIPPPPRVPLTRRLVDLVLWGGLVVVLLLSFGPVQMSRLGLVFSNSANMRELGSEFLRPDMGHWALYVGQMWLTIQMALWGTFLALVIAIPFGLACARNISPVWLQQPMRILMNILRSAPDLVIGVLFIVAVGIGPLSGVMALALNTGGVLAKLFSEAVEAIDPRPVEGVRATGASRLQEIVWGVIPQVGPLWTSYALYRFESNARSATVLGLIGAGGIGQLLFEGLQSFNFSEVSAISVVIVVAVSLIDLLSQFMRKRLI